MDMHDFKAAILDTDSVITQTAKVHARAWKELRDAVTSVMRVLTVSQRTHAVPSGTSGRRR